MIIILVKKSRTDLSNHLDINLLRRRLLPAKVALGTRNNPPPDAAVAVIIDSSKSSILLIRRTERISDPWSGQIAFPGGHRAPNDNSFLETAIREVKEEVGISLDSHEALGALPVVYARNRRVRVAPFVFQLSKSVKLYPNLEVADTLWAPISELTNSSVIESEVLSGEEKLKVDSYIYKGNVIWGLTFRIITILLGKEEP
jgi:8-oxo-dGTP pyrophosphatase MutT (NUDIX family)